MNMTLLKRKKYSGRSNKIKKNQKCILNYITYREKTI